MKAPGHNSLDNAVAVVGMGCRFPGSPNLPAFWRTVRDSRVWSGPIPRSRWNHELFYSETVGARDHNKTYVNRLCMVEDPGQFAPDAFGISPRRARIMDPQQRLFLDAVRAALEDAGYAQRPLVRDRVGTYVGATVSDFMDLVTVRMRATLLAGGEFGQGLAPVDAYKALTKDLVPLQAYTVVGSLLNMVAANVNQCFDFGGPAFTTDAACSSALVALHEAVLHLRHGICDTAIVGGVYMVLSPDNVLGFARIGAVSMANACRPFDQRADGFVVGEGVGAVVLKRLSEAVANHDHIYAVIRGVGINNDGRGEGPMTPRKEGQVAVLERAYSDAQVDPRTIDFIEAHGTATPVGDATEVAALAEYRGVAKGRLCALSSVKANVGHSMSAAGIAGLIRGVLSVDRREITPHAAYAVDRPELALQQRGFFVPQVVRAWDAPPQGQPRRAGVNSFGFGGTNVHVVLEEAPPASTPTVARVSVPVQVEPTPPQPQLFLISAPTLPLLQTHAADLRLAVEDDARISPEALAYTLGLRKPDKFRAAFVATTLTQVLEGLQAVAAHAPEGDSDLHVFKGQTTEPVAQVVFLFPGQGAQSPGLARDLYDRFAGFRRALDELTNGVGVDGRPLLSYLYPHNGARERAMTELTRTEVCQPIMAAVGLATARWLRTLNVIPAAVAGHSLGEFAAAADAGVLAPAAAVQLVATRGQQIAQLNLPDAGAMAALAADQETCLALLAGLPEVWVANINHPRQTVISGTHAAVDAALARAESKGIKARPLQVSHAFHSPLMQGLQAAFEPHLASLSLQAASTTLVSGVATGTYPTQPDEIRALWAAHATSPVNFLSTARQLAAAGGTVFVQMGAGHALANMARASLSSQSQNCVYLSAAAEIPDGAHTLLSTLAQIFVAGIDVRANLLFEDKEISPVTVPPSVLETRHLWPVKKDEAHPRLQVGAAEPSEPLSMSKPTLLDTGALPAAGHAGAAATEREALFRQQMAVLETHAAIIRQQNELLLRADAQPSLTVGPAPEPPAQKQSAAPTVETAGRQASSGAPSLEAAQAAVIAAAARITASPASRLNGQTRLAADLGFDSLMVVELGTALAETYVGLELPRSAFAGDTTIAQLAREVVQALAGKDQPVSPDQTRPLECHAVDWQASPLPTAGQPPIDDAPIFVIAPPSGFPDLGSRLVQSLIGLGRAAQLVDSLPEGGLCQGSHLLDLRPLAPTQTSDLVAPVLHALADAQNLDASRPASWRLVRAHLATAGLDGFAKSLDQEWEHTTVACLAVDHQVLGQADLSGLVAALASELVHGSTCRELRFTLAGHDLVRQVAFTHAAPTLPAPPAAGGVVLISGGSQGLGAKLARALVASAGAHVALLGRRSANDASVKTLLAELTTQNARAHYVACDVRNADEVNAAVEDITQTLGPITLVVHAAGVSADAPVGSKDLEAAAAVLATKLQGATNLWNACVHAPLQAFLALGSLAGRFGNASQTDYAAANSALAPLLQSFHQQRPNVRTSVLDLPPWEGGGLLDQLPQAARKALAGRVRFATDDDGLPMLLGALGAQGPSGEFVVTARAPAPTQGFAWHRNVSVRNPGYLADHIVAARPVLPLAGAVDWMLEAARAAGRTVPLALAGLTVVEGVVLDKAQAALRLSIDGEGRLALVRVDGRPRVGFRAHLQASAAPARLASQGALTSPRLSLAQYYAEGTFHGPSLRAITAVAGLADNGIAGNVAALAVEGGSPLVAALDGVLQLFGLWSTERHGRGGLPLALANLFVNRMPVSGETLTVRAHAQVESQGRLKGDADVVDAQGALVLCLRGFEAEPLPQQVASKRAAAAAGATGQGHTNGNGHHNGHVEVPDVAVKVPSAHFRIDEFPEVKDLQQRMAMAKAMNIAIPYFRSHEGINAATATISGQTLINFSSYNYLGFSGHPEVTQAAKAALDRYGSSVSASRIASGERPLHNELEAALAQVIGVEDAIVMVGGHATNVSVLGHLLGPDDLVVHDSLAHDSILGGAKLSGARRRPFPHNDTAALERILRESRSGVRRVLIAIEGVYSMDGDIAPLDKVLEIKKKYGALLLVDEAHSIGVLGANGRGVGEHFGVNRHEVDLWMGTLSKSFASCGGYIAGSHALVQYLRYTVPGFVYSVGISPANAAAALAAIRLMQKHPELPVQLREKSKLFLRLCRERGLDTGPSEGSAVIPCVVGNSYICLQLSQALLARGINVQPILYPAVEENQARLRFFVSVTHTEEQLRSTANVLAEELFKLQPAAKPSVQADPAPPPGP